MLRSSHTFWLRLLAFAACGLGGCIGPGLEPPSPQASITSTPTPGQAKQGIDAGATNTAGASTPVAGMMPGAPAPTPAPATDTPAGPVPPAAMMPAPGGDATNTPTVADDDDDDAGIPDAAVTSAAAVAPDAAAVTPAP
jgi:hypothetical protein